MLVGYVRTSTTDQHQHLQQDALRAAGCEKLFTDAVSGATTDRPGLGELLHFIRQGDTLVVWKLDRLGRSLRHLVDTIGALKGRGIEFRSLTESIDTSTPAGKLVFHIFAALAEFERDLIRERVQAGYAAARARGVKGGRPPKLTVEQRKIAIQLLAHGQPHRRIAKALGCGPTTILRLKASQEAEPSN